MAGAGNGLFYPKLGMLGRQDPQAACGRCPSAGYSTDSLPEGSLTAQVLDCPGSLTALFLRRGSKGLDNEYFQNRRTAF